MKRSNLPAEAGDAAAEDYQKSYASALRLLARREHSELELRHKLSGRRFAETSIDAVIANLLDEGLLSDRRFAEQYIRSRFERGYGPLRIQAELRERGVGDKLIECFLEELSGYWCDSAGQQRERRFGRQLPANYRERAKQMRFLQQRGFAGDQIRAVFSAEGLRGEIA